MTCSRHMLSVSLSFLLSFYVCFCFVMAVQPIPLLEAAFTRCTVILVLSYIWLRKVGQPLSCLGNVKNLLISRALMGFLSLMSFVYW